MIRLYDYELCGDCYKVRLLLNLLGLEWETRRIDYHPGREHESEWFLRVNPLGRIPVIEDGGCTLRDAQAILVYLAARYDDSGRWYPRGDAKTCAEAAMWLAFAGELTASAYAARLHEAFAHDLDLDRARSDAHRLFRVLDEHLWFAEQEGRYWLCAPEDPTIADIACFPGTMLCEEGGISRMPYPAVRRWTERVKRIPGFVPMPGIFPHLGVRPLTPSSG